MTSRDSSRPPAPEELAERRAQAGIGCYRISREGVVRWLDDGAFRLFELTDRFPSPDAVVGTPIAELRRAPAADRRLRGPFDSSGALRDLETPIDTLGGRRRWVVLDAWLTDDGASIDVVLRDVTRQRRQSDARWEAEALARRSTVESIPIGVHVYRVERDGTLRFTDANPAADRILGLDNAQFRGKTLEQAFPGLVATDIPARYREVAATGRPWSDEQVAYEDERIAGAFEVHAFRPEPGVLVVAFLDITERKRSEAALRESEERYRAIFDSVGEAIFIHDIETGAIVDHNRKLREMYEVAAEDVPTLGPDDIAANIPPYTTAEAYARIRAAVAGTPQRFEWLARRTTGALFWAEVSLHRARIGEHDRVLASVRDVTARKEAEERLRERERQLATLMANLPGMVYRCRNDENWTMEFASEGVLGVTGYPAEDLVLNRRLSYASLIAPEDRTPVWDEVQAALAEGRPFELTYRIVTAAGERRWVAERGRGITDDAGDLVALEGFVFDITERVRAEEQVRELNAGLERRVRERTAELEAANEDLEAFAYSVSHDLRAPLRSIEGFGRALSEDHGDQLDEAGRGQLERILRSTTRMSQLIDDLLELSRVTRTTLSREDVDLSEVAAAVVADLRANEPEREVDVRIEPGLVQPADASLVRVLLENLLGNAWKFTARRENARIELGLLPPERIPPQRRARSGRRRVYVVRDNGAGFDMAFADRLFHAFQRLHDTTDFPGIGVGLAIAERIVARHGGLIWAEGSVGAGAAFFFSLCCEDGPPAN